VQFAIGSIFDGNPHDSLPDVVGPLTKRLRQQRRRRLLRE
jgi:hypothetical protein